MPESVEGAPTDIMAKGLSGLMEVAVHPDFEQNRLVYLTYTRRLPGGNGTVALVRGRYSTARRCATSRMSSWRSRGWGRWPSTIPTPSSARPLPLASRSLPTASCS